MTIEAYSDGASGNKHGKPGGYGWVLVQDKLRADDMSKKVVLSGFGGSKATSNNLMEMEGAYQALLAIKVNKLLRDGESVILISDSQITLGLASGSMCPSKNVAEATRLREIFEELGATTRWVKGHSLKFGEPYQNFSQDVLMNERCDQLAGMAKDQKLSLTTNQI